MRTTKAILLATALTVMATSTALAESGAPSSQFGFSGWPYRQSVPCATQKPCQGGTSTSRPTPAPDWADGTTQQPPAVTQAPPVATRAPVIVTQAPPAATPRPATPTRAPQPVVTQAPSMDDDYTTVSTGAQELKTLNLVNSERAAQGLSALTLDPELSRLARIKCEDMRDNHYFAHESPTYGRVADMLTHFGYSYAGCGENIAHHATVDRAHVAFMSSEGHRRNILASSWTKIGIGVCYDANGYVYVTEIFVR